jgi:hypothetical protein
MPAQEQEQQRLLNQLNHLLYAHLLKVRPATWSAAVSTAGYQHELGMRSSSTSLEASTNSSWWHAQLLLVVGPPGPNKELH